MHSGPMGHGPGRRGAAAPAETYKFSVTWGKLITYCKAYWLPVLAALVAAIGGAVFTILGPDRISELTDIITQGMFGSIDLEAVTAIAVVLVVYYGSSMLLQYVQALPWQRLPSGLPKTCAGIFPTKSTVCR